MNHATPRPRRPPSDAHLRANSRTRSKHANMTIRTRLMFSLSLPISRRFSSFQAPVRHKPASSPGSPAHFFALRRMLPPRANPP